jgi:hypothetical protein
MLSATHVVLLFICCGHLKSLFIFANFIDISHSLALVQLVILLILRFTAKA